MAGRAATPQGRKLNNINNMPDRRYLPSICTFCKVKLPIDWTTTQIIQIIIIYLAYTSFVVPDGTILAHTHTYHFTGVTSGTIPTSLILFCQNNNSRIKPTTVLIRPTPLTGLIKTH
jgi:hypothetical protein